MLGASAVDVRTKEIVILHLGPGVMPLLSGVAHGGALDSGLSIEEVRALRDELPVIAGFAAEEDRSVITWCDALVGTGSIDPEFRDGLRRSGISV